MAEIQPDGDWGKQRHTEEEFVARLAQGRPSFEPDAKSQYNNAGYHLLGYIVEKAGRKPYPQALKERITSKTGLADTYLGEGNTSAARGEALAYMYFGDKWIEASEPHFSVVAGAGGIVSTATDLAKFIQALFDRKLVSADSLKPMTTMRDGEGMGMVTFSFAGKNAVRKHRRQLEHGRLAQLLSRGEAGARLHHECEAIPGTRDRGGHIRHLLEPRAPAVQNNSFSPNSPTRGAV